MAVLDIIRYPDPRLHKLAKPVERVDDEVRRLVRDMAETMYAAPGIGLAATQVDVHRRVIVIDTSDTRDQLLVLINPEIVERERRVQECEEGCLSVPGIYATVTRAAKVTVRALDRNGIAFERTPRACWRCASSTRWTTSRARCSSSTSRASSARGSASRTGKAAPADRLSRIARRPLAPCRDAHRVRRHARVRRAGARGGGRRRHARSSAVYTQPDRPAGRGLASWPSPGQAGGGPARNSRSLQPVTLKAPQAQAELRGTRAGPAGRGRRLRADPAAGGAGHPAARR